MPDHTSKYFPLERYLRQRSGSELPVTFREVEAVLGFPLPPSARAHPAWWSNNRGTNVAVKAWRDAGWRTSRVDIGGERVTFVREGDRPSAFDGANEGTPRDAGVSDVGAAFVADAIVIDPAALRGGTMRMLQDYREAEGGSLTDAIVALLNGMALERRRQLVEHFKAISPKLTDDSTDIIRADRDAR
jgi:hypothetical protein